MYALEEIELWFFQCYSIGNKASINYSNNLEDIAPETTMYLAII